jgi:hypothetical protein
MKKELEVFPNEELQAQGSVELPEEKKIVDAEWCFQFFNNEPVVFAFSNEGENALPLQMQIEPIEGQGLNFQQNGMVFKMFPRPISEETKLERAKENQK